MKFLCLCYYNVKQAESLTPDALAALSQACEPHYAAWQQTGKLVNFGAVSEPKQWKRIRPTDSEHGPGSPPLIQDGAYLATPEQIGAFFIVEANDIDEAVEIAAKHPDAHVGRFLGGGIQVCPCEAYE